MHIVVGQPGTDLSQILFYTSCFTSDEHDLEKGHNPVC